MSALGDIQDLLQLSASIDSGQMDEIYSALAQRIAGQGAKDIAEATELIRDAGDDPAKFIPVSRTYVRNQERARRLAIKEAEAAQKLKHEQEIHEMNMQKRQLEIETQRKQLAQLGL